MEELLHRVRVALQLCATLDLCKAREVVDCILLRTFPETCLMQQEIKVFLFFYLSILEDLHSPDRESGRSSSFKEARELSDADILQMHLVLRVDIVDADVGKCFFIIFMVTL